MIGSSDERVEQARAFFADVAAKHKSGAEHLRAVHMVAVTEAVQEVIRSLDMIKNEIHEIRHTLGVH